jgi:ABC-type transporter Mla subunit MlaD
LASDLSSLITQLEQQRDAIDRALSALREIGGTTSAPAPEKETRPAAGQEV